LHQAFAVAQVDKDHAAMVTPALHPTAQAYTLPKMLAAHSAAVFASH
jgi:hypothetical protein